MIIASTAKLVRRYGYSLCALVFFGAALTANALDVVETHTTAPAARFAISAYDIQGNTLISKDELDKIVAPYTGESRDFGDVQSALQALQLAYQKLGYNAIRVILPEQSLENGIIHVQVIQQKIASVTASGNVFFDSDNIINSIPALKVGEPPNARAVARNIRVANENPSKLAVVHFKTSESDPDAIDANIRVIDENPQKFFLTLDNTGNRQTKDIRVGIGYQNYNMFNRDHRLTAQFVTTPQWDLGFSDLRIFALGYTIPLYARGDSIDFLAAYSDVNAGSLLDGAINIASKGIVLGAHYNWNLDRIGDYQHKLNFGIDYRDYEPEARFGSTNLTPEVEVTPVSVTYSGLWRGLERQFSFNVGVIQNIASITSHGHASDLAAPPWLAEDNFTRFTWGADFTQLIKADWQLHLAASGQFTGDHLHPGEQFGLGGMDSVRGWHERAFSGDEGYRASIELVSPNFGKRFAEKLTMKALAFYDLGHVENQDNVLGNKVGNTINIGSVGAGLRFGYGKHLLGRTDFAVVVDGDKTHSPSATYQQSREGGDTFLHVSLAWVW